VTVADALISSILHVSHADVSRSR